MVKNCFWPISGVAVFPQRLIWEKTFLNKRFLEYLIYNKSFGFRPLGAMFWKKKIYYFLMSLKIFFKSATAQTNWPTDLKVVPLDRIWPQMWFLLCSTLKSWSKLAKLAKNCFWPIFGVAISSKWLIWEKSFLNKIFS